MKLVCFSKNARKRLPQVFHRVLSLPVLIFFALRRCSYGFEVGFFAIPLVDIVSGAPHGGAGTAYAADGTGLRRWRGNDG